MQCRKGFKSNKYKEMKKRAVFDKNGGLRLKERPGSLRYGQRWKFIL